MVELYIAPVFDGPMGKVYPPQRQAQLDETKKESHRRPRYTVWKLLEYGLTQSLGLRMDQLEFSLDDRGRWSCRECFFSLSHTEGAVAVAISLLPIGVDLERLGRELHPALARKLLSSEEQAAFTALEKSEKTAYLLEKWCETESLFKWREAAGQLPAPPSRTGSVSVSGQDYCYAITAEEAALRLTVLKEDALWS